jgi:hypothetical protein
VHGGGGGGVILSLHTLKGGPTRAIATAAVRARTCAYLMCILKTPQRSDVWTFAHTCSICTYTDAYMCAKYTHATHTHTHTHTHTQTHLTLSRCRHRHYARHPWPLHADIPGQFAERYDAHSYGSLVRRALGRKLSSVLSLITLLYLIGSCVAYLVRETAIGQACGRGCRLSTVFCSRRCLMLALMQRQTPVYHHPAPFPTP